MILFFMTIGAISLALFMDWGKNGGGSSFGLFKKKEKTLAEQRAEINAAQERTKQILLDETHKILEQVPQDHLLTLYRKRKMLRIVDDYGIADDNAWRGELEYYYKRVLFPNFEKIAEKGGPVGNEINNALIDPVGDDVGLVYFEGDEAITAIIDYLDSLIANSKLEGVLEVPTDPYEYEEHCAEILRADGWNARRTSGSGDQGADVIAEKDGVRAVIQCKLFSSPVGNKAVQEVTAARIFYSAQYAIVLSNQSYTRSAKKLANATGAILMHHDDIPKLPEILDRTV
jgi:restriction system protein